MELEEKDRKHSERTIGLKKVIDDLERKCLKHEAAIEGLQATGGDQRARIKDLIANAEDDETVNAKLTLSIQEKEDENTLINGLMMDLE